MFEKVHTLEFHCNLLSKKKWRNTGWKRLPVPIFDGDIEEVKLQQQDIL
jgi:hypothetical protein